MSLFLMMWHITILPTFERYLHEFTKKMLRYIQERIPFYTMKITKALIILLVICQLSGCTIRCGWIYRVRCYESVLAGPTTRESRCGIGHKEKRTPNINLVLITICLLKSKIIWYTFLISRYSGH